MSVEAHEIAIYGGDKTRMECDNNEVSTGAIDVYERLHGTTNTIDDQEYNVRDCDSHLLDPKVASPLNSNIEQTKYQAIPLSTTHPPSLTSPSFSPPQGSSTPKEQDSVISPQFLSSIPSMLFSSSLTPSQPTGLCWSPCGNHIAVSTDTRLQLYSMSKGPGYTAEFMPSAEIKHAECLYSWTWSSGSYSTASSILVTTGRYQPVQLYSCQTTENNLVETRLESTYKCINQLDELSHSFSVALDKTGTSLFCGLKGEVRVFDVNRPGRISTTHVTKSGQNGIISCLAVSEILPVYAAGCYDKTVGLYSTQGDRLCVLRGQMGGVTQVTFTKDGTKLLAGGRKDNEILCWDLRQPGMVLFTLQREVNTNQTIQFSLSPCEKYLSSANTDGSVRVWNLENQADSDTGVLEPVAGWLLHKDASNGIGWHPDGSWLATCSGQRHFKIHSEMDIEVEENVEEENSLVVWNLFS